MKNTCPKCDTAYNVSAAAVGRKFTCKNCGTPLTVTAEGLDYQNPPASAPPAEVAAPATGGGGAFDFGSGADDEDEPRPPKAAKKVAKPARGRIEDEEVSGPKKAKPTKAAAPEDADDFDALPARKAKKKGGQKNIVTDFLFFREFVAPLFVKLIFFISVFGVLLFGLATVGYGVIQGTGATILGGLCSAVIFVPLGIFMVRVYCELILLGFSLYDRLGEIKNLLEKGQATTPAEPPSPPE
ncbi:MAG TPA: DUF4282 domain-containing protein [Gemmata sp.]